MSSVALVWLRRDLRLHDHPALTDALAGHDRVAPVFVLDDRLLSGRFSSVARTAFLLGCLAELRRSLRRLGCDLVVRRGAPERELSRLVRELGASAVFWTSDVSPFARARDGRVTEAVQEAGARACPRGGAYCVDVSQPRTQAGDPYTVFTPFWRATAALERRVVLPAPQHLPALPEGLVAGALPDLAELGLSGGVAAPVASPGEAAGRAAASAWLHEGIGDYDRRHDDLTGGTSVLSPYLRWGCLSARELEEEARAAGPGPPGPGAQAFVRQLAWRDFYAHVLLPHPENVREAFQPRGRRLEWADDPARLAAWQQGQTGYPLVDAGMRQLMRTGWMHNRARMVVGSFLTKDLHLDWREGEAWFERLLLDGEPAQNNGNWQWVASVGVDPAPVSRRMFNPVLQAQRFDPDGTYVHRWVPELADVPTAFVHEPWTMDAAAQREAGCVIGTDYPERIVDHAVERSVALERYRAAAAAAADG